jgi:uncharacterized protein YegJ (DUF2314 family)
MKARWGLVLAAVLTVLPLPALAQKPGPGGVIGYEATDARMNAAIDEARRTLPFFLEAFVTSPEDQRSAFSLKLGLTTYDGGVEHIWVSNLRLEGGAFVGELANEPIGLPGMALGSPVDVDLDRVSDWSILAKEGLYGGFTMRVMLADMPPQQREEMQAYLSAQPLPEGW